MGGYGKEINRGRLAGTAIPIDPVIGACAQARGVEVVCGDLPAAIEKLGERRFDCVLLSNVLHLVREPVNSCLRLRDSQFGRDRYREVSQTCHGYEGQPGESVFVDTKRIRENYEKSGMHVTTGPLLPVIGSDKLG